MNFLKPLFWLFVLLPLACGDLTAPPLEPSSETTTRISKQTTSTKTTYTPRFKPDDCPFDEPDYGEFTCGYLIVPQNRAKPQGKQVELAVAILHAESDTPEPDPIFYFEGGPGGIALADLEIWIDNGYNATRDMIIFDQRGTGYSTPDLNCPEFDDEDDWVKAAKQCRKRLLKRKVDLTQYNSAATAADFHDLRQVLGYGDTPVNLYGISYGTRVALTIMRDYPDHIRSVLLDSVYPPNVDAYEMTEETDRVFNRFFEGCANSPYCAENYPDLKTEFYTMVAELNEEPLDLDDYDYLVSGDDLLNTLYSALYDTEAIPELPWLLYEAAYYDDAQPLLDFADEWGYHRGRQAEPDGDSEGMNYSVQCHEELPFSDYDSVIAEAEEYPHLTSFIVDPFEEEWAICELWQAGTPPPLENEAVYSDLPTLILAGSYDPTTPLEWGKLTAETISRSTYLEFPGHGHGISVEMGCATEISLAFFDDPTGSLNQNCLADLPNPPDFE